MRRVLRFAAIELVGLALTLAVVALTGADNPVVSILIGIIGGQISTQVAIIATI